MRTTRLAKLGAVAAVAALAVTGWLTPAWGQPASHVDPPASQGSQHGSFLSLDPG